MGDLAMACEDCGRPTDEHARKDARYCSSACRQRAYRERSRPQPSDEEAARMIAELARMAAWFEQMRFPPAEQGREGVTDTSRNGKTG